MTSAITILAFLAGVAILVFAAIHFEERKFRARFSSQTDAEYLAQFKPGTNPDVALRVRSVLADCLGVDEDRIHAGVTLKDLGAE